MSRVRLRSKWLGETIFNRVIEFFSRMVVSRKLVVGPAIGVLAILVYNLITLKSTTFNSSVPSNRMAAYYQVAPIAHFSVEKPPSRVDNA